MEVFNFLVTMSSIVAFVKKHPYLTVASTVLVVGGVIYYADQKEKQRQAEEHKARVQRNREESRKREEVRKRKAREEAERKLIESREAEEKESEQAPEVVVHKQERTDSDSGTD